MAERKGFFRPQPAQVPDIDQSQVGRLDVNPREIHNLKSRARFAVASLALIALAALACREASQGSPQEIFGFEIPSSITSLEEALNYADQQSEGTLVKNEEVAVYTRILEDAPSPEARHDLLVLRNSLDTSNDPAGDFRDFQNEWKRNIQILFDQWNICDLRISWDFNTTKNSANPWRDFGLDPDIDSKTPGCKGGRE